MIQQEQQQQQQSQGLPALRTSVSDQGSLLSRIGIHCSRYVDTAEAQLRNACSAHMWEHQRAYVLSLVVRFGVRIALSTAWQLPGYQQQWQRLCCHHHQLVRWSACTTDCLLPIAYNNNGFCCASLCMSAEEASQHLLSVVLPLQQLHLSATDRRRLCCCFCISA
jgi:hypothetical protein